MRIRHLRLAAVASAVAVLIGLGSAAPAFAASQDDLSAADSQLGDAVDTLIDVVNASSSTADDIVSGVDAFVTDAQDVADQFQQAADSASDASIKGFSNDFAAETRSLITAAQDLSTSVKNQDQTAYGNAIDDFNAAADAYSATADEYNQYLEDNPVASGDTVYGIWFTLLIIAIVLLIASIVFAVVAKRHQGALPPKTGKDGKTKQTTLAGLRRNLIIWSAVFVVGAAIPFVQYWILVHNGGDSYYIFWYPLAAGAILFVVSVVQYLVATVRIRANGSAPLLADAPPAAVPGTTTLGPTLSGGAQPADTAAPAAPAAPAPEAPAPEAAPAPQPTTPPAPAPSATRGPWDPK